MSEKGYTFAIITEEDAESVLDFLRKFFFRDEPASVSIGLHEEEWCAEDENYCLGVIPDGMSMKAVTPSGQIIGVSINRVIHGNKYEAKKNCKDPKYQKLINLQDKGYNGADIVGRFPHVDKILGMEAAAVDTVFRKRGIAMALFDEVRKLAREKGFQMMRGLCTSHFTALALDKMGFQLVYTINYADYKGEDGKPIFSPKPPHTCAKTYVYHLK